jgi:hypothetical protein
MEDGSPEWIEASLARLDELERERAEHEEALETAEDPAVLKKHTEAFTRLDAEIKDLYAKLEAVADDSEDDESDGSEVETSVPRATQGDDELSAPHITSTPPVSAPSSPVAKPIVRESDNPFGSGGSSFGGGASMGASTSMGSDDDIKPKGGGAKWAFLGLVVVAGVGVGGYFVWQDMQTKKPAPTGPVDDEKVIRAKALADDTEEPKGAPSGDATISPTANQPAVGTKKKKKDDEEGPDPLKLKSDDGPL